jgi:hypothetical protein
LHRIDYDILVICTDYDLDPLAVRGYPEDHKAPAEFGRDGGGLPVGESLFDLSLGDLAGIHLAECVLREPDHSNILRRGCIIDIVPPGAYDEGMEATAVLEQIECSEPLCHARFNYVPARRFPTLCLEHSDDASRDLDGWTPENSVD